MHVTPRLNSGKTPVPVNRHPRTTVAALARPTLHRVDWPLTMRSLRSSTRRLPLALTVLVLGACGAPRADGPAAASSFGHLVASLSEPGGYFDTDNLISNERSYLHAVTGLERLQVRGGAYVGVGPDQNFSYIAAIEPEIAFIVDIRRDNVLQHLMFKALFDLADSRLEYLCLLHARPIPDDVALWRDSSATALIRYVDSVPVAPDWTERAQASVATMAGTYGVPLSDTDQLTIRGFHSAFVEAGLDLRFQSHGRRPRWHYPTFRDLVLETDRTGRQVSFLASEDRWRVVEALHERDAIVPVVGDFAGSHALAGIAALLERRGLTLSAFYTSNVEYYLIEDGTFGQFVDNVSRFPIDDRSVFIRSFFGRNFGFVHPDAVPGYYSVQLLQRVEDFAARHADGGYRSYGDLVTHALVPTDP